uniref:R13L1/DRL21-like LRR repeat region domain-containing protein n=1 Tax=Oryza punctata TaxID=4537 RepID=A0A0E0L0S4_ORYPU
MPSGFRQLTRLTKLGLFVVGCRGDDTRISELETLDMLSGDMNITNLKYMQDPANADRASLKRKNNIKHLVLDWSRGETEKELVLNMVMEQYLAVLNALEPPSKLEETLIYYYGGPCLPRWMRKQTHDSSCWEGTMLKQTSPCQLLYLTRMTLQEISNLKHMQGLVDLHLLNYLKLFGLPNLEDMWTTITGSEIREYLRIAGSNDRTQLPESMRSFTSLQDLNIHEACCRNGLENCWNPNDGQPPSNQSIGRLTSLTYLTIGCNNLKQLPETIQHLMSLRALKWSERGALTALPEWIGKLSALHRIFCPTVLCHSMPARVHKTPY